MKKILLFCLLASFTAFGQSTDANQLLTETLDAHGGLKKWQSYEGLSYTVESGGNKSMQTIQLHDRRTYHKTDKYEMGFNGKKTWVKGDKDAVPTKNPDFFHNIDFYFFAMPFVIADPGVKLNDGGQMNVKGKSFDVLEVSYGDGVGVASKDSYKLLIDPTTHQMEWLLYTVTFFDKTSDKFSAKHYTGWKDVQGIMVPTVMENYKFVDGEVTGEPGVPRKFTDIKFYKKMKDSSIFEAKN